MFDIGFSEFFVIALVALIVIGPERLPRVARMAGHMFGRMQRYVSDVKADINREMELEDLRKMRDQFNDAARSVEEDIQQVSRDMGETAEELNRSIAPPDAGADPAAKP
jgi:sec-independent protein translocase protein TatB